MQFIYILFSAVYTYIVFLKTHTYQNGGLQCVKGTSLEITGPGSALPVPRGPAGVQRRREALTWWRNLYTRARAFTHPCGTNQEQPQRTREEVVPIPSIYNDALIELSTQHDHRMVAPKLPGFTSLKSSLYRSRRSRITLDGDWVNALSGKELHIPALTYTSFLSTI